MLEAKVLESVTRSVGEGADALDPDRLKEQARQQTGLDAFGTPPLDEGLEVLCQSLRVEAALTVEGREAAEASIVSTLVQRLKLEEWLKQHGDVAHERLAPALFVIGMPRSGTTALSQHLFEDPGARSILRWELTALVPGPGDQTGASDPRIEAARQAFAARDAAMPWRRTLLPVAYDDPSEHGVVLGLTFLNLQLPTLYRIPSYETWISQVDLTPAYAYLATVLRVLQSQRPATYWNLKNPPDLFALNAIDKAIPGSRFIWTHRDPVESMSSVCSLTSLLREKQQGASTVDKAEIGRTQLKHQAFGVERAMEARQEIDEARFVDVYQADLIEDLVSTMSRLYDRLKMPFTASYRASLLQRSAAKPKGRFGNHEHHLEDYGLNETAVQKRFKRYIERFNVPLKC